MSREIKDLFSTDWCSLLEEGDTVTRKEGSESIDVVLLAGLQRLARQAGISYQGCVIQTPSPSMVQAIYTATFRDVDDNEVSFVGTADCSTKNTSEKFAVYPTAVAESRAEARCLRKALGIKMLSSEEIGFREGAQVLEAAPGRRVDSQIVAALETLCNSRGVDPVTVLEAVLDDKRASSIFEFGELTTKEAQDAMAWLNEQGTAPVKKQSAKDKRDARKAELQGK